MDDGCLIEAVRARSEIYDKSNAAFKNPALKERSWQLISESMNASSTECSARWNTLRERFVKEKRQLEQETRSGSHASGRPVWVHFNAMGFLSEHIRKRKSVSNLATQYSAPLPSTSADADTLVLDADYVLERALTEGDSMETTLSTPSSASVVAASLPYMGPSGRSRKRKADETEQLFRETLTNFNKSLGMSAAQSPEDVDSLIGKNVELCLKSVANKVLKIQFRKKFRALIQECEEAALMDI